MSQPPSPPSPRAGRPTAGAGLPDAPLVSCLCVTENRAAFMPWLLWCFDRQTWPHRELLVVDSSPEPLIVAGRDDVRVVLAPPGAGVGAKRNLALDHARGEIVAWFDDDDWQHPGKLACLVDALRGGAPLAGSTYGWFVNLADLRCAPYRAPAGQVVFNSAAFLAAVARRARFDEAQRRASDTRWMQALAAQYPGRAAVLDRRDLFFWLCHDANLSNPARGRRFSYPPAALSQAVGPEAWGDTDEALAALRDRLERERVALAPSARPAAACASRNPAGPDPRARPPVGVMIKATVMDAPTLDVMVRHMIAQARFPFAERAVVVDRHPAFSGKYASRPRAGPEELDRVLRGLLADGVVDVVRDVDTTPSVVRDVTALYFGGAAAQVPTHAVTGGPIYATLFGLESMSTDYVLQMDADVFFHTGAESWVARALDLMARDPRLWLMMTHPGPPAGPPGRSLGPRNSQIGRWDGDLGVWRFRQATTRYFVCDRRRLRGALRPIFQGQGCAPLEQCIGAALQRHDAFRGSLGDLESWHLHAWYHGDPFPGWAASLAAAIAAGRYPASQRGDYDLRLDRLADRRDWQALLAGAPQPAGAPEPAPEAEPRGRILYAAPRSRAPARPAAPEPRSGVGESRSAVGESRSAVGESRSGVAPLSVVIPVRDRAGQRLRSALDSLAWQTAGRPAQVVVASQGSRPDVDRELATLCDRAAATLLVLGDPAQAWNKPLALNAGIRATLPDVPYLMTMDADMILAPNFFEAVLACLRRRPALVLCQSADLPRSAPLPPDAARLVAEFGRLRALARPHPRHGTGGIQAAPRDFFFDVRGYDEDLVWWGAMDGDMVNRARAAGLAVEWIDGQTAMLHQWHPPKHAGLADPRDAARARAAWRRNHELVAARAAAVQRNLAGWGGVPA